MPTVKFKKLPHFTGHVPSYQSTEAAGCDIHAALQTPVILRPGARALIPSGLALEIPQGFEIQVRPRSGLAAKSGIMIPNSPGTIDSDYRGEVKIILLNLGSEDFPIQDGDRVAQLVMAPVVQAVFEEASGELAETGRGQGGFGSTGVGRAKTDTPKADRSNAD